MTKATDEQARSRRDNRWREGAALRGNHRRRSYPSGAITATP